MNVLAVAFVWAACVLYAVVALMFTENVDTWTIIYGAASWTGGCAAAVLWEMWRNR